MFALSAHAVAKSMHTPGMLPPRAARSPSVPEICVLVLTALLASFGSTRLVTGLPGNLSDGFADSSLPEGSLVAGTCLILNNSTIVSVVHNSIEASSSQGQNTSHLPPESQLDHAVEGMWEETCGNLSFDQVIATHGARNFSLGLDLNLQSGGGNTSFMESWNGVGGTHEEYWLGNLTTLAVSGPFVSVHPTVNNGGMSPGRQWWNTSVGELAVFSTGGIAVVIAVTFLAIARKRRKARSMTSIDHALSPR